MVPSAESFHARLRGRLVFALNLSEYGVERLLRHWFYMRAMRLPWPPYPCECSATSEHVSLCGVGGSAAMVVERSCGAHTPTSHKNKFYFSLLLFITIVRSPLFLSLTLVRVVWRELDRRELS